MVWKKAVVGRKRGGRHDTQRIRLRHQLHDLCLLALCKLLFVLPLHGLYVLCVLQLLLQTLASQCHHCRVYDMKPVPLVNLIRSSLILFAVHSAFRDCFISRQTLAVLQMQPPPRCSRTRAC
jgi:hypothetical protein